MVFASRTGSSFRRNMYEVFSQALSRPGRRKEKQMPLAADQILDFLMLEALKKKNRENKKF